MILIPINTDAPIYHFPWATLGLIATNVAVFGGLIVVGPEPFLPFVLDFGEGLHPHQWLTWNFLHGGYFHLIVNMFFLWGFGLVVEGKLGWWRFLLSYLGIGCLEGLIVQVLMLGYPGPGFALGASGAIFGMLAMSLVWAPKNEMTMFWYILITFRVFDVTILTFSIYFIALQVLSAFIGSAFAMSSEILHIVGGVLGFGLGTLMLKKGWVDCEDWDLFAVWNGTHGQKNRYNLADYNREGFKFDDEPVEEPVKKKKVRQLAPLKQESAKLDDLEVVERDPASNGRQKTASSLKKIRKLLAEAKPNAAHVEYDRMRRLLGTWPLAQADLKALIDGLYRAEAWPKVVPLMEEFVKRFPEDATRVRLKLCAVLVEAQTRPTQCLKHLAKIPRASLDPDLERFRQKIETRARKLLNEGVAELQDEAWS